MNGPFSRQRDDVPEHLASTADLLRGALTREAASVSPSSDALARIRAAVAAERDIEAAVLPLVGRSGGGPVRTWARRAWLPLAAAAAVATLFVASPHLGGPAPAPTAAPASRPAQPTVAPLPIYFLARSAPSGGAGAADTGEPRWSLVREFVPTGLTDPAVRLDTALRIAVAGRSDNDYTSVWRYEHVTSAMPADLAGAVDGTSTGTSLIVTLAPTLRGDTLRGDTVGSRLADLAVQQLLWTATAVAQRSVPVQVRISGEADQSLFGQPLRTVERTIGAADPRAPVWISSLSEGQTVKVGQLTISGDAVPDRPVTWTLARLDGDAQQIVATGLARATDEDLAETVISAAAAPAAATPTGSTATGSTAAGPAAPPVPTRVTWTVTATLPGPGRYLITVEVPSGSGPAWADARTVVVR